MFTQVRAHGVMQSVALIDIYYGNTMQIERTWVKVGLYRRGAALSDVRVCVPDLQGLLRLYGG